MAGGYEDLLPCNWSQLIKNEKGTLMEWYVNRKTGQIFYSKEDYERYMRYVLSNRGSLTEKFPVNDSTKEGEEQTDASAIENPEEKQKEPDVNAAVSGDIATGMKPPKRYRGGIAAAMKPPKRYKGDAACTPRTIPGARAMRPK